MAQLSVRRPPSAPSCQEMAHEHVIRDQIPASHGTHVSNFILQILPHIQNQAAMLSCPSSVDGAPGVIGCHPGCSLSEWINTVKCTLNSNVLQHLGCVLHTSLLHSTPQRGCISWGQIYGWYMGNTDGRLKEKKQHCNVLCLHHRSTNCLHLFSTDVTPFFQRVFSYFIWT